MIPFDDADLLFTDELGMFTDEDSEIRWHFIEEFFVVFCNEKSFYRWGRERPWRVNLAHSNLSSSYHIPRDRPDSWYFSHLVVPNRFSRGTSVFDSAHHRCHTVRHIVSTATTPTNGLDLHKHDHVLIEVKCVSLTCCAARINDPLIFTDTLIDCIGPVSIRWTCLRTILVFNELVKRPPAHRHVLSKVHYRQWTHLSITWTYTTPACSVAGSPRLPCW